MLKLIFSLYICNRLYFISEIMFEFDQYLGFLAFAVILLIGFWLMIFLMLFVPYWIGGAIMEMVKEKKAAKNNKDEE